MINSDQPTCFDQGVTVRVSSRSDGTVLDKMRGVHHPEVVRRREEFCRKSGIDYIDTVYQRITYGDDRTYDVLKEVTKADTTVQREEVQADGLFTRQPGVGLLLPVADCAATVVYDPVQHMVALLHLGRHSSLTNLIEKTIHQFIVHGSRPHDLIVWMSPHVKRAHYRLEYFASAADEEWRDFVEQRDGAYYIDMAGHNTRRFVQCGVSHANIHCAPQDTAIDPEYYSHTQGDTTRRFAVLTYLTRGL
jgi:copper oxidase (laccase) domain-containing protein